MAVRVASRPQINSASSTDPATDYDDESFISEEEEEENEEHHRTLLTFCATADTQEALQFHASSVPACERLIKLIACA